MSQFNFGNLESPLSGEDFINDNLEPWRDALHTNHSGSSRPAYAVAGMMWLDTTTNPWVIKWFTGSADISLGTLNTSSNLYTPAGYTISSYIQTLLDDANASTARATLGLVIGGDVQAFNSVLTLLAGLTAAADKGIYFTGGSGAATFDLTSAGRALLDDADVAAQWVTLGLGTAAGINVGTSANQIVQLTAAGKYPAVDGSLITNVASDGVTIFDGNFTGGATTEDFTWTAGAYRRITLELIDLCHNGSGSVSAEMWMRFFNNGTVAAGTNNYHTLTQQIGAAALGTYNYDVGISTPTTVIRLTEPTSLDASNTAGYTGRFEILNCLKLPLITGRYNDGSSNTFMSRLDAHCRATMTLMSGIRFGTSTTSSSRNISSTSKIRIKGYA